MSISSARIVELVRGTFEDADVPVDSIRNVISRAREARPNLATPDEALVQHLMKVLGPGEGWRDRLESLNAGDLLLALACGSGDRKALEQLEAEFLVRVPIYLGRMDLSPDLHDEVAQKLRQRLLVASESRPPRILDYAGRGNLDSWMRVAAIRLAVNQVQRQKRPAPLEEGRIQGDQPAPSPELELLKRRYRADFEEAFQGALRALPARSRNLLRLRFVDRLTAAGVAAVFGVHRATVNRWVAEVKEGLFLETRKRLQQRLGLSPTEFDSLMTVVRSRLEISIESALDVSGQDGP